jgi:cation transport ATPase
MITDVAAARPKDADADDLSRPSILKDRLRHIDGGAQHRGHRCNRGAKPVGRGTSGRNIRLSAGDLIPADARLLETNDLHVQQAALTGESMPFEKQFKAGDESDATMAKHKVIVKHLSAIQNLGSIDVLCSDKMGTLTRGSMARSTASAAGFRSSWNIRGNAA